MNPANEEWSRWYFAPLTVSVFPYQYILIVAGIRCISAVEVKCSSNGENVLHNQLNYRWNQEHAHTYVVLQLV
jgi:hypothetical protein